MVHTSYLPPTNRTSKPEFAVTTIPMAVEVEVSSPTLTGMFDSCVVLVVKLKSSKRRLRSTTVEAPRRREAPPSTIPPAAALSWISGCVPFTYSS